MKRLPSAFLLILCLCSAGRAADVAVNPSTEDILDRMQGKERNPTPDLDPKRIINQSNSFLKEKEPEMTSEEYALYENVMTTLEKKPALAIKLLEGMTEDKKQPSPAFLFILGNAYYAAGQIQKSETSYRQAVDRFPTFIRAWNNLGILYYTGNRYDEAGKCFNKSYALGDRDPLTIGLLGCCLEKSGEVIAAEQALKQAIAADSANPDWKEALLRIYIESKQYGSAEALVKGLIKLKPSETRHWLTYANILLATDRKKEVLVLLEVAREAGLAGPDELSLLADLYAEQNLAAEAIGLYQQVLPASPQVGMDKLLRFAQMFTTTGRLNDAQATLTMLEPHITADRRVDYLLARGELQIARKQWKEARSEFEALLALAPLHGRALLRLGRTYAAEEDFPRATFAFESAYQVPEVRYQASLELANIELRNRRYEKAVQYLEKALSLQKSDQVADYLTKIRGLIGQPESSP